MFHDCPDSSGKPSNVWRRIALHRGSAAAVHLIRYDRKLEIWRHRTHIRSQAVRIATPAYHLRGARGVPCLILLEEGLHMADGPQRAP